LHASIPAILEAGEEEHQQDDKAPAGLDGRNGNTATAAAGDALTEKPFRLAL
jgi:hypothetical protein